MENPFLDIETKQDSLERILALAGVPSEFKYTADEWNQIRDAINELYQILEGSDLQETFDNNILLTEVLVAGVNTAIQAAAKINAIPSFSVTGNELVRFKTYQYYTDLSLPQSGSAFPDQSINTVITYYELKTGKGTYGQGGKQLQAKDLFMLPPIASPSLKISKDIGEIGTTNIASAISESGTYQLIGGMVNVFRATRNGQKESYLYTGGSATVGIGGIPISETDLVFLNDVSPSSQTLEETFVTNAYFKEKFGTMPIPDFAMDAINKLTF